MYDRIINQELRKRVGLEQLYPYSVAKDFSVGDVATGGLALVSEGHVILAYNLTPEQVPAYYLHEVAHLVTCAAGLEQDPSGPVQHNRFFACLVAIMYRRAGILERLGVYDFGDTSTRLGPYGSGTPTDQELVERFEYIIRRSAELAALPLSVESLARKIAREDLPKVWSQAEKTGDESRREWASWLLGFAVGTITATAASAAYILL